MAKLTDKQKEFLAPYGITPANEEDAKEKVKAVLKENGLEDLDEEDLDTLLSFLEAFPPVKAEAPAKKKKPAVEEEEDEVPAPAKKKKPAAAEEEEEDETPAPTKKKKAAKVVDEDEVDELAEEVNKAKPAKVPPKPAVALVDKKAAAKAKTGRKPANGDIFSAKDNEEHAAIMKKKFGKLFPKEKFILSAIVTGFTVRFLGENAKIVILKYSNVRVSEKGALIGDLNFKKIKEVEELKKLLPESLEDKKVERVSGRNYTRICDITDAEFAEFIGDEDTLAVLLKKAKSIDTKMGNSRAQMEESLKGKGEKEATAKKAPKKPVVEEEEDETPAPTKKKKAVVVEEEEEEAPAPVKKAKKPVVEEEEEAPAPVKKKKPVVVEEEEEAPVPAKKKKKPVVEEDED